MAINWLRTSSKADVYGYTARVEIIDGDWKWCVSKGRILAWGTTKRESSARTAARRWILKQPDAAEEHAIATRRHWNGRPFDGARQASWGNSPSEHFRGACGATTGSSTNYSSDRGQINCAKCLELLSAAEYTAEMPAPPVPGRGIIQPGGSDLPEEPGQ